VVINGSEQRYFQILLAIALSPLIFQADDLQCEQLGDYWLD